MPPKNKRQPQDEDKDEAFQAVILTDSYDEHFLPISAEMPRCLMPLCNVPLIEYTLEVLAISDVEDVFIVCTSHIDKIKNYFQHSTWTQPSSLLNIQIIQAPECMSVGDALREVDARQLITTDFILTFGDLVSNIKLDKALEQHRARKKTDKNSIMTMVLKEATRHQRPRDASSVFVLDPKSAQCVFYEPTQSLPRKSRIELSPEAFEHHAQLEFRNDLLDPFLDICSVEVPALFSENFDWQKLRSDFVHGILTSDILGKTIYTNVVADPYIAHIQNEHMYSTVSKHVLNRWTFPIVPETNLRQDDDYVVSRGNVYKASNVILSRSCIIDEDVQIGPNTTIGENTRIANTIIGRNCHIGDNVVLDGAFVWDGVTIQNNSRVSRSILASGVTLLDNTTIRDGCLVSVGVTLGPDETIEKYARLSLQPQPKTSMFADDSDDEEESAENAVISNPSHPDVYCWSQRSSDDDDEDIRNLKLGSLAFDMKDLTIHDDDLAESASEVGDISDADSDDDGMVGTIGGAWNLDGGGAQRSMDEFRKELAQTVERSLIENHTVDTAALEITGLRMSSNASYDEVRDVLIPILLDYGESTDLKAAMQKWSPLVAKVTHGHDDQVHLLHVLQRTCAPRDTLARQFLSFLQQLYSQDVIEEDAVFRWYVSDQARQGSEAERALRDKAKRFVDWLQEAEEESSEEDDSEEEE